MTTPTLHRVIKQHFWNTLPPQKRLSLPQNKSFKWKISDVGLLFRRRGKESDAIISIPEFPKAQVAPPPPRTRPSSSLPPRPLPLYGRLLHLSPSFPNRCRRLSLSSQFATRGGAAVQIADRSKRGLHSQQSHESQFASPLLPGSTSGTTVKKNKMK